MATNLSPRHSLSCSSLLLVSLLTLVGILSGCGASSPAGPSHPSGSTPTSTPTHQLTGTISEIALPAHVTPGDITNGPDGNLWFIAGGTIGRITPAGTISEFPLPSSSLIPNSGGPNTITKGPDRALWFTDPGTAVQNGKIGRITLTGTISEFPLPTPQGGPGAITGGPDGTIWFIERNSNKIGHLL